MYRVALERLWGKHPEITIERDPFADPEDANVEMDLNQPFDDSTPSEKQPTFPWKASGVTTGVSGFVGGGVSSGLLNKHPVSS
ncbi:hypothetical protein BHE74_00031873 [Ensete ventricosum]|nr:hypothetical protein BHE74_00031873 [Ensete ventricosum]